jgi:hypothetical protein
MMAGVAKGTSASTVARRAAFVERLASQAVERRAAATKAVRAARTRNTVSTEMDSLRDALPSLDALLQESRQMQRELGAGLDVLAGEEGSKRAASAKRRALVECVIDTAWGH